MYKKAMDLRQDIIQITDAISDMLKKPEIINKVDKNYIMMLFKYHNYSEGVIELSKIMEYKQELLLTYMEKYNYPKIIDFCKEYGKKEMNFWIQALNYFINANTGETEKYIKIALEELTKMSKMTLDMWKMINQVVETNDVDNAYKSLAFDRVITEFSEDIKVKHIKRLQGRKYSADSKWRGT